MNGTLALWYEATTPVLRADAQGAGDQATCPIADEPAVPDGERPSVELHFNLWRDLASRTNFLDIGFLLKRTERLRRFNLYVPAPLDQDQLTDLSGVLRFGQTLNAVFNEVVRLGRQGDHAFGVFVGKSSLTVHQFAVGDDVRVEALEREDGGQGTLLVFTERLCARMRGRTGFAGDRHYLRLRLLLRGPSREVFSEELSTNDGFFVPSGSRLEVTELRLNEKRSYPVRVAELAAGRNFEIAGVHYFLIRDLRYQLIGQHAPFRKVRRLEARLWRHYLVGEEASEEATRFERVAARMVIYHWRVLAASAGGTEKALEDFLAFASFRSSESHLGYYAVAVVLLGGMGSALAALLASLADPALGWLGTATGRFASDKPHPNWANGVVVATLGIAVLLLAGYAKLQPDDLRRVLAAAVARLKRIWRS